MESSQELQPGYTATKSNLLRNVVQDSELTLRQQLSMVGSSITSIPPQQPQQSTTVSAPTEESLEKEHKRHLVKHWISLRFDLVEELLLDKIKLAPLLLDAAWSDLLTVAISAYPSSDPFSRQHLRVVVEETAFYLLRERKFASLPVGRHAELVSFMAQISPTKALELLNLLPVTRWTDALHAMSYHLEWQSLASKQTIKAEQTILEATRFTMDTSDGAGSEDDEFEYFDWNKASSASSSCANLTVFRHLEECAKPTNNPDLQKQLKNGHWMSLRVKFESVWRSEIESKGTLFNQLNILTALGVHAATLPHQSIIFAFSLIESITSLAIHFGQFEYCWYWSQERSNLPIKWAVLQNAITCCRLAAAADVEMSQVWRARGWVLYKNVGDIPKATIHGKQPYIDFMVEFTNFVKVTETNDQLLQVIPRIITDMINHCSATFFPIVEGIVVPLLEVCWNFRNTPREKWELSFRKVFEVYVLHKFYKTRRGSTISNPHFFSPASLVTVLSICTVAGFIDEFKILNRDILMAISEKQSDYVVAVQRGYAEFVKASREGGRDIVVDVEASGDVEMSTRKIVYDENTLAKLQDLLVEFLSR